MTTKSDEEVDHLLERLSGIDLADAVVVSRWIKEIGEDRFTAIVSAFAIAGQEGRPKEDYSRWLNEFARLKSLSPNDGDYAIASRVAKMAFDAQDWQGFRPPANAKSMAQTIVNRVKADDRDSRKDSDRDREVRSRVQARAAVVVDLTPELQHVVSAAEAFGMISSQMTPGSVQRTVASYQSAIARFSKKLAELFGSKQPG